MVPAPEVIGAMVLAPGVVGATVPGRELAASRTMGLEFEVTAAAMMAGREQEATGASTETIGRWR